MALEEGVYYMFHTGPGINIWNSKDMEHWNTQGSVFTEVPEYMFETIPGFSGHLWAPDIYQYDGTWYLYYSVSAFGKNTSFIGVATSPTLNPESPEYGWTDHGIVIQSFPGMDNFNAIDPNIIDDENDDAWMSFGSFWSGLKIVKLSDDRLTLADSEHPEIIPIASRIPRCGRDARRRGILWKLEMVLSKGRLSSAAANTTTFLHPPTTVVVVRTAPIRW